MTITHLRKKLQLPFRHLSSPLASLQSTAWILYSVMGVSVVRFPFSATLCFLLFFSPRLQHGVLHRPPSSQRHSSFWVSMCTGILCHCTGLAFFSGVSCPDWLLPLHPVSLKLVSRSYPKPNHSPSAVRNVLPQASLQSHSLASSVLSPCWYVWRREETLSWGHRKKRCLNFTLVPGHSHCSRSCPVKRDWRPSALRVQQKGIAGMWAPQEQERCCGMVCELSGRMWAVGWTWVGFS